MTAKSLSLAMKTSWRLSSTLSHNLLTTYLIPYTPMELSMHTHSGTNTWSPSIYKSECPTDWAAERAKSKGHAYDCGSKRTPTKAEQKDENRNKA